MGLEFALPAGCICLDDRMVIDTREGGEGIDGDEDDAGVGVDGAERVAVKDRVED